MGRDKALVAVGGVPMAVRVASALRGAGAAEVTCVGGDLAGLRSCGLLAVPDPRQGEGPLGGLVTALEVAAARHPGGPRGGGVGWEPDAVVVVACDLPWLEAAVPEALVARLYLDPAVDVVCARTDRPEPLCAAWRPHALAVLRRGFDGGERAVHRAWASLRRAEVDVDPGHLRDVDHPADLDP